MEGKDRQEILKNEALKLPEEPGVYIFYNEKNTIIYIGKAKRLKNRVSSYFNKTQEQNKTKIMVRQIARMEHIVVESETDSLLLENNLIKKYQPRYNILLKDDKTYPWICIKKESFPRVFQTRNIIRDGSKYYGPYTSVKLVRVLTRMFHKLFQLRTCSLELSQTNIEQNKFKVCLEYHIDNCKGPCVGLQSESEYLEQIEQVHNILRGNFKSVRDYLNGVMKKHAQLLEFEKAQKMKEKIDLLKEYQSKSTVMSSSGNYDVFSILSDEKSSFVNYLKIVNGAMIYVHTVELIKKLNEPDEELLSFAVNEIISEQQSGFEEIKELIVPFLVEIPYKNIKQSIPKIGDKLKLLQLSERNAKYFKLDKEKQSTLTSAERRNSRILNTMKQDLKMDELPVHIECFDNSNIQGTHPVAACVVFKNAKPSKRDYRKFTIKTVEGPDDFATMEEVIFRRYRRMLEEEQKLPQLIIIDGGKGQLSSAVNSLKKLDLYGKITIIGIAKRLEEIFFPEDPIPLYLDKNSETLKVIQNARNEAHRFGIAYHRDKRSKDFIKSELENMPGIGKKVAAQLLRVFKTVDRIAEADEGALAVEVGKKKAGVIVDYFRMKRGKKNNE
jgi:excinuclease ABC subunit C